jgi:hypothetical protein
MLIPNPAPSTILHRKIKVSTAYENSTISEPHKIVGPLAQNINSTKLAGGRKVVIPLTETLGEGGHFLKIHLPNTFGNDVIDDSTMYVTFCRKDNDYLDGYKDYEANVTPSFVSSIKLWIDNGQTPNTTGEARTRYLTFSAIGRETNQAENAIVFKTAFSYVGVTDSETDGGGEPSGGTGDTVAPNGGTGGIIINPPNQPSGPNNNNG